jgi:hypothetical protein
MPLEACRCPGGLLHPHRGESPGRHRLRQLDRYIRLRSFSQPVAGITRGLLCSRRERHVSGDQGGTQTEHRNQTDVDPRCGEC